jgi:hypothetical protein
LKERIVAVYNSRLLSQVETYLKVCEFLTKLEKCPNIPMTRKLKRKLSSLIETTSTRPSVQVEEEYRLKPMKLSGLYRVKEGFLDYIEPWEEEGYYEALIAKHEAENMPVCHPDDEGYYEALIEKHEAEVSGHEIE